MTEAAGQRVSDRASAPGPVVNHATRSWTFTGLAAMAPVSWGTTYLVTSEFLPPGIPLLSGVIRVLPAGLLLLLISRTLPRGEWWWRSAALGTLNIGAFNTLLFVAAYRLPGGVAAILTAMQPLLVAGIAFALLKERPTRWRLGWGVVGVAGVGLIVLRGSVSLDIVGILAGLAAAASMATGVVLTKRWGRPANTGTVAFTGWQLTASGLLLAPLALAVEGLPPLPDAAALGGYAWLIIVGTALAYVLWFQGLGRLPVAAVSFLPLLSPAVATTLGWLVLGQSLTPLQGIGFALALLSIAAAQLTPEAARSLIQRTPPPSARRLPVRKRSIHEGRRPLVPTRNLLITGSTGTVSGALIDALQDSGFRLRALIRDESRADMLLRRGVHPVVGDLGEPRSLPAAFEGIHDLWLLTPNDPRAPEHSMNAVRAARQAGVERVVRLSAVGAAHDAPTRSGRLHALSDHELAQSGLCWTVLRPHWFMQNLLEEADDIATEGTFGLNMGRGRLGMIDARDIAALAARVFTDGPELHHGGTYTPTGPRSISFAEVAEQFEELLPRPIRYVPATDEDVEKRLLGFGVPDWIVGMLTEYAQAYRSGWGDFTTTDVEDVTGRPPRSVADFIRDHADAFTS